MADAGSPLNFAFVKNVAYSGQKGPDKYFDEHGLMFRVRASGRKHWMWRGTVRGRRGLGLGSFATEYRDGNGRIRRKYLAGDVMTPYARLRSIPGAEELLEPGLGFALLDTAAAETVPACPKRSRRPRPDPAVGSPPPRCLPRRREAARLCVAAASECPRSSPNDASDTRFTLTSRWNRPFASPSLRVGQYADLTGTVDERDDCTGGIIPRMGQSGLLIGVVGAGPEDGWRWAKTGGRVE